MAGAGVAAGVAAGAAVGVAAGLGAAAVAVPPFNFESVVARPVASSFAAGVDAGALPVSSAKAPVSPSPPRFKSWAACCGDKAPLTSCESKKSVITDVFMPVPPHIAVAAKCSVTSKQ